MSFFSLTYGINTIKKNKQQSDEILKSNQITTLVSSTEKPDTPHSTSLFPNCAKIKSKIKKLELNIKKLEISKISQKLKDKKLEIIIDKLQKYKEILKEKLNVNTSLTISEINPLCSFKETQK